MISLFRAIFKNNLIAGIVLIALSFLPLVLPSTKFTHTEALVAAAVFMLGVILAGNYIILKVGGFSLLSELHRRSFIAIAIILFTLLQFAIADLGGVWFFPYWSVSDFIILGYLLGGWVIYMLFLVVAYEAIKLLLDKFLPSSRHPTKYYKYEPFLYRSFLFAGVGFVGLFVWMALKGTHFFTEFSYTLSEPKEPYVTWPYIVIFGIGIFLISEYVEYKKHRTSFTKDVLHGYLNPLLAVVVMSLTVAVLSEWQNLGTYLWRYDNYPLGHVLGLPVSITWAWAWHVVIVIAFWRAFGGKASGILLENRALKKAKNRKK